LPRLYAKGRLKTAYNKHSQVDTNDQPENWNPLFNFGFFVNDMSANHRIKFFDLHFLRHVFFVFSGGIEVASAFSRNQFNFVTHVLFSLNLLAAAAHVSQYRINTVFIDDTHTFRRYSQTNPTVFAFYPKSVVMQIRRKTSFCSIHGVGNVIACSRTFTGYLTYSGHDYLNTSFFQKLAALYNKISFSGKPPG
jgi:hypothetical protein